MRTEREVQLVAELLAGGLNDSEVARATGLSRTTVREWRRGHTPRRVLAGSTPVCVACGARCLPLPRAAERAYSYLLGQYLGDGSIVTHRRKVHRLGIYGDGKYESITAEVVQAIEAVVPDNRVLVQQRKNSRGIVITAYSRKWPCLFPQHGPGPKHLRKIRLREWQQTLVQRWPEMLIRGLIHSDGCRFTNWTVRRGKRYEYPRYTFTNHSEDIRGIFCEYLDLLGIAWRQMNAVNISVARREAVARLDEFVGSKS